MTKITTFIYLYIQLEAHLAKRARQHWCKLVFSSDSQSVTCNRHNSQSKIEKGIYCLCLLWLISHADHLGFNLNLKKPPLPFKHSPGFILMCSCVQGFTNASIFRYQQIHAADKVLSSPHMLRHISEKWTHAYLPFALDNFWVSPPYKRCVGKAFTTKEERETVGLFPD